MVGGGLGFSPGSWARGGAKKRRERSCCGRSDLVFLDSDTSATMKDGEVPVLLVGGGRADELALLPPKRCRGR